MYSVWNSFLRRNPFSSNTSWIFAFLGHLNLHLQSLSQKAIQLQAYGRWNILFLSITSHHIICFEHRNSKPGSHRVCLLSSKTVVPAQFESAFFCQFLQMMCCWNAVLASYSFNWCIISNHAREDRKHFGRRNDSVFLLLPNVSVTCFHGSIFVWALYSCSFCDQERVSWTIYEGFYDHS